MNRVLIIVAIVATIVATILGIEIRNKNLECRRLEQNQHALLSDIETFKTKADEWACTTEILQLEIKELRRARSEDIKRLKEMGIRLKHAESYAKSITQHKSSATLPLHDSIVAQDTVRTFHTQQGNTELHGLIRNDSISYTMQSTDTLYQVIHRVPHKFLFFCYGTRAIRQTVWSSNPNTKIIYNEYIELRQQQKLREKRRR